MKTALVALVLAAFSVAIMLGAGARPPAGDPKPETPAEETKPVADTTPAYVKLTTSMGDIYLELNREKAPITTANFISYVEKGHYDGTIFHRVIPDFMIQGGGFDKELNQKPTGAGIKNEWQNGLKNTRGTIAMARLGGRPDSATAQFFINVKDNTFLDEPRDGAGYAVFGKVIAGMDVVDKIKGVRTQRRGPHEAVPVEPVVIEKAQVITADEAKAATNPAPASTTDEK
jgi:peptidyl-prolyl cis-trans isomerase A (cyclophilin A)